MPLVIVVLIGVLAFGLFDLTLGRPLPESIKSPSNATAFNGASENIELPSIKATAISKVAHCETHNTACELLALYHFVVTTVVPAAKQPPWLHAPQHPVRTLLSKTGNAADIALLLSSLLDQRHIRNYVIALPDESYVLACDILPSALRQAGSIWQPAIPALDPNQVIVANDPPTLRPAERIDPFALHVSDAPCPCFLLDPSSPRTEQPGDSLPFPKQSFHYAIDLIGQRHELIYSGL